MTDMVCIYPDEFELAMDNISGLNVTYCETEGEDFRVDFSGGYSVWLRAGRCVEGVIPRGHQPHFNRVITSLGIKNYVEYR